FHQGSACSLSVSFHACPLLQYGSRLRRSSPSRPTTSASTLPKLSIDQVGSVRYSFPRCRVPADIRTRSAASTVRPCGSLYTRSSARKCTALQFRDVEPSLTSMFVPLCLCPS